MTTQNSLKDTDEANLIIRARANDYAAYEKLYRQHVGRVFGLCLRLLKDQDLAEDLTQDSFVKAWKSLDSFRGDSAFGSWLHRIATNLAISHLRKNTGFLNEEIVEAPAAFLNESAPDQISLERAIAELPEGARTVFVLYCVEGYTHQEIADLLAIAVGSSKAHLHRARQQLQARLS